MKSYRTSTVIIINLILTLFINHQNFSQIKLVNGIYYLEDQKMLDTTKINSNAALKKEIDIPLSFIKKDFKVNNTCGKYGSNQLYPDIAMGDKGDYILVWIDERTGAEEVLAQIYNAIGEKKFGLIDVSSNTMKWNVAPNVIFNKVTKEYLITWASDHSNIRLQRLDVNGNRIGSNIVVNNELFCNTNNPSVATDKYGNIMVTWYSQTSSSCSGSTIAFVKLFDKVMKPITYQRPILDENRGINSIGRDCRIAADTLNNFVIVWSSYENEQSKIFLQKINSDQWIFEENTLVSQSSDGIFPTITGTSDGNFLISWTEKNKGIAARLYSADSGFISDQFFIVQDSYYSDSHSSSSDEAGNFYVASGSWKANIHKINKYGEIIDSTQIYNSKLKSYYSPKLSDVKYGRFYYAIYGYNNGDIDIRMGCIDSSLTRLSPDVLYEEDECSSPERKPKVKFNKDGESIIVWESNKDGYRNIYGQTYDKNFNPMSEEFLISDSSKYRYAFKANITADNSGNYLISFSDEYYEKVNAFQKISSSGEKLGSNFELSKNGSNPYINSNSDQNSNTLFCWRNAISNYKNNVFYQQFNSKLNPIHEAKLLSLGDKTNYAIVKDVYIDEELNILVFWNDYDVSNKKSSLDLKALLFNKNGDIISDTIHVYSGIENTRYGGGKCMNDGNGNYIFSFTKWLDNHSYSSPKSFVIRKYSSSKTCIDSFNTNDYWSDLQIIKFKNRKSFITYNHSNNVSGYYYDDQKRKSTSVHLKNMTPYYPNPFDLSNNYSCDLYQDKLFLAYEIVKEKNKGIDIWANVQDFSDIYSEIDRPSDDDNEGLLLFNPYPNPSNTDITIEYIVKKLSCIKLIVYNSIGQVVKIIDQGVQYPGVYYYNFSIANLSSGVYFIGDFNLNYSIKKFIIIK